MLGEIRLVLISPDKLSALLSRYHYGYLYPQMQIDNFVTGVNGRSLFNNNSLFYKAFSSLSYNTFSLVNTLTVD